MSDWIPIKTREPIEGQEVLVVDKWNDVPIVAYLRSDGRWVSDKTHIELIGDARMEDYVMDVTHWMPLPKLPEAKDE